ncbi:hypothetical protein D3C74_506080 [compost metagenome]
MQHDFCEKVGKGGLLNLYRWNALNLICGNQIGSFQLSYLNVGIRTSELVKWM